MALLGHEHMSATTSVMSEGMIELYYHGHAPVDLATLQYL